MLKSLFKKNERGAVVIEATISLSMFMFAILTILSIVNICYAQAKIATAINSTAKEISQYSYWYGLTGLNKKEAAVNLKGSAAKTEVGEALNGVEKLVKDFDPSGIESWAGSGSDATLESFGYMLLSEGISTAKNYVVGELIIKPMTNRHLVSENHPTPTSFLNFVGIKDGINYNSSSVFSYGSNEIIIVARYEVQVIKLLDIDVKLPFVQTARTKAWFKTDLEEIKKNIEEGKTSGGSGGSGGDAGGGAEEEKSGEGETEGDPDDKTGGNPDDQTQKSPGDYASDATHGNSDQVILGKYNQDGLSYLDIAMMYNMTYFELDNWNDLETKYGTDFMWEINKEFLQQQHDKGNTFYLSHDPDTASGAFAKEVAWLESKGYTFEKNEVTGLWRAVKN